MFVSHGLARINPARGACSSTRRKTGPHCLKGLDYRSVVLTLNPAHRRHPIVDPRMGPGIPGWVVSRYHRQRQQN